MTEDDDSSYGEDENDLTDQEIDDYYQQTNDENIEFDGTTVLCRVCGDKASGFHYGVHSCEGCKGFFRRSIQQKIQYRPCTKNQQCSILRINRNRCQYCRLKKCIGVGMSRDAVRFGRVPKREKAKILAAMQKVNADVQERALSVELEDEAKLMTAIMRAHDETCDYTKEKVIPLLERARNQPVFTHCPSQLACPLNPPPQCTENGSTRIVEDFSERFWPAIRGVVEFAKRIPGFSLLAQDDQVTLLKAGVFEVLLVRLACMFDHRSNAMICLNGQVLRREAIHAASNARFLLDSMFDFSERLNALRLSDHELGLFSAVVVIAPDRPGIRNLELVHKIQKKLSEVLQKAITINHPENPSLFDDLMKKIPDLRTLNTLHSEKLLAYKMEPHIKDNTNAANGSSGNNSEAASSPEVASTSVPHSPVTNGGSSYADLINDPWVQYTMRTSPPAQTRVSEEDRSDSPGQLSQHNGSTTGSEWSTTDSKDRPERFGSPRSVGSSVSVEEAKSPVRANSFSSTRSYDEGVCSNDAATGQHHPPAHHTNHLTQHHPILQQHLQQTQPHYAQHLQISQFGKRPREALVDHSSSDESFAVESPIKAGAYHKIRRVDSPTDSGIESGKEHGGPMCTPTASVCSSPHSSMEEKVKDVSDSEGGDKQDIDDMPVLKRALQAPPLINTTMLMDEAYRHHKKFRAARKESDSPSSQMCPSKASLASAHSTLVKTLEQAPRYMNEQQLKRTDFIHNIIMRNESIPAHCAAAAAAAANSRQDAKSPQQQNIMVSCPNNVGEMNGNYATYQRTVVTASSQGNKMVVCPPGYYIPAGQAQMTNSNNPTNNNNTPTSWSFLPGPQATCPYTGATATSNSSSTSVTMVRTPVMTVISPSSGSNSPAPTQNNTMSPPPAMNGQRLVVFDPRGNSAANCATLVSPRVSPAPDNRMRQQNGGSSPSPNAMSPPATNGDSQPLNLSKKMSQPTALKMES